MASAFFRSSATSASSIGSAGGGGGSGGSGALLAAASGVQMKSPSPPPESLDDVSYIDMEDDDAEEDIDPCDDPKGTPPGGVSGLGPSKKKKRRVLFSKVRFTLNYIPDLSLISNFFRPKLMN